MRSGFKNRSKLAMSEGNRGQKSHVRRRLASSLLSLSLSILQQETRCGSAEKRNPTALPGLALLARPGGWVGAAHLPPTGLGIIYHSATLSLSLSSSLTLESSPPLPPSLLPECTDDDIILTLSLPACRPRLGTDVCLCRLSTLWVFWN